MVKRLRLEDAIEEAKPKGRKLFQKGMPRPQGAGRRPGQTNKTTVLLKEAILMAAEAEGDNQRDADGPHYKGSACRALQGTWSPDAAIPDGDADAWGQGQAELMDWVFVAGVVFLVGVALGAVWHLGED
jgi:hypothetical protein